MICISTWVWNVSIFIWFSFRTGPLSIHFFVILYVIQWTYVSLNTRRSNWSSCRISFRIIRSICMSARSKYHQAYLRTMRSLPYLMYGPLFGRISGWGNICRMLILILVVILIERSFGPFVSKWYHNGPACITSVSSTTGWNVRSTSSNRKPSRFPTSGLLSSLCLISIRNVSCSC